MQRLVVALLGYATFTFVLTTAAHASPPQVDWKGKLERRGFSIETREDIQRILGSNSTAIQMIAVHALGDSKVPERVAFLRLLLDSQELEIRALAAQELARLGDESGLEPMRRAFAEYVGDDLEPDDYRVFGRIPAKGGRIFVVLEVAEALALLGDPRAGRFAEMAALYAPLAAERYRAVRAVTALLANVDRQTLEARDLAPAAVLKKVARTESDRVVLTVLRSEIGNPKIQPAVAIPVLQALVESRHLTSIQRRTTQELLAKRRTELNSPSTRAAG